MKNRYRLIAAAAVLLSGGSSADTQPAESSRSETVIEKLFGYSDKTDSGEQTQGGIEAALDYSALSAEKHGYGQGVQLDEDNRPLGALDFNERFGGYNATAIDPADKKTIRLTFDEGYENGYTSAILDVLKDRGVKATFFVLEDYAVKEPKLVQRMIDEGHTVGNHSVHHYSMPDLSAEECRREITGLHDYILDEFGYEMTEFRPPKGEFSERSLAVARDCGYETVLWSFAYADWDVDSQPPEQESLEKLKSSLHNGAIYLLHPVSSTNAAILGDFIDYALSQGYEFV